MLVGVLIFSSKLPEFLTIFPPFGFLPRFFGIFTFFSSLAALDLRPRFLTLFSVFKLKRFLNLNHFNINIKVIVIYIMKSSTIPWVEKYRPDSFDKIILDSYNKQI